MENNVFSSQQEVAVIPILYSVKDTLSQFPSEVHSLYFEKIKKLIQTTQSNLFGTEAYKVLFPTFGTTTVLSLNEKLSLSGFRSADQSISFDAEIAGETKNLVFYQTKNLKVANCYCSFNTEDGVFELSDKVFESNEELNNIIDGFDSVLDIFATEKDGRKLVHIIYSQDADYVEIESTDTEVYNKTIYHIYFEFESAK